MSKVKVSEELCIGCGTCESLCPNVFKMEDGKSHVIAEECGDCNCQNVIDSCPVSAISIEE
jgi:ferredoxin